MVSWEDVAKIIDATLEGIAYFAKPPAPAVAPKSDSKAVSSDKVKVEAIYLSYPRKVGRRAAIKAIEQAAERIAKGSLSERMTACVDPEAFLLAKTKAFSDAVSKWPEAEQHFCPHPSTWFNQERYDDDPKEWVRGIPAEPTATKDYSKL